MGLHYDGNKKYNRINLFILECKLEVYHRHNIRPPCINLFILECKSEILEHISTL